MFEDSLDIKFTITGKKSHEIPGGHVKHFSVRLYPYGFFCKADFWLSSEVRKDEMYPEFVEKDLLKAKMEILPHFPPTDGSTVEAISLQGPVYAKKLLEERTIENIQLTGNPVLYRHYEVEFADPATVLWRQHFPCDLMVDKSLKDMIEAHKGEVAVKYQWDILNNAHPIVALSLGIAENSASFYDFILWYVFENNGVWTYDAAKNEYTFSGEKSSQGQETVMNNLEVEGVRIDFPQTVRHSVNLLNSYTEKPEKKQIANDQGVDGISRDRIGRFPVASDFSSLQNLETSKLFVREHEVHLDFRRFPLLTFRPGVFIKLEEFEWSKEIFSKGQAYRVRDIHIDAGAVNEEATADHEMGHAKYNLSMTGRLEKKAEKYVPLPSFVPPVYPMLVEGKIVSEQGAEKAETYQIYQDSYQSLDRYKIDIPLFKNQKVIVDFEPFFFPGHFYFPVYKNARVLVALELHSGRILRFLDWREEGRLPMEGQGNHLLFGKTPESKTSVQHKYVDEKPQLTVTRVSAKDTQLISITEGSMILEAKENK